MNAVTVTDEAHDPRSRFGLYRLCECPVCGGSGREAHESFLASPQMLKKCPECRGEGRQRQLVAECESPEAVGVALVTLARESEWKDCPFGLLDRDPTADCKCALGMKYHALNCSEQPGLEIRKWLVLPWQASPRNVRDAARTLARSKTKPQSS